MPFNQYNPLPLLLISLMIFHRWKAYSMSNNFNKGNQTKRQSKHSKMKKIDKSVNKPEKKNDIIEYKFEKMNIKPHPNESREEEGEEKKEQDSNDFPNYPCTKNIQSNLFNE